MNTAVALPGRREIWSAAAIVMAAGTVAYANSFSVPFVYDDLVVVVGEPAITGFHPSPLSRRFLGDLSFALSWRLFGARPAGHHAVNLAIHLANALLVYALARLLGRSDVGRGSTLERNAHALGCVASLLFVAHPLQTQAVTYVVQRYASLATAFSLLALVSYLSFRVEPRVRRAAAWYGAFLLATAAAFWTKENAYTLPLVVVTVELLLFRARLRRRLLYLAPFLVGAAALLVGLAVVRPSLDQLDALTRVDTAVPRSHYLITQFRVVAEYLRLLFVPYGQNLDHDVPVYTSILQPAVLLSALLHLSLIAAAARAARAAAPWLHVVALGILWFYETLLVESSIIPIVDVMYEHRAYLPSVGIFLALAALLVHLPRPTWSRAKSLAVGAVVILLVGLTVARNRVWQNELTLWLDVAQKSPGKARPLNNVGAAYAIGRDFERAAAWFARAIQVDPGYTKAWFNYAEVMQEMGRCDLALPYYERFAAVHPGYAEVFSRLATCYGVLGDDLQAAANEARRDRLNAAARGAAVDPFYR